MCHTFRQSNWYNSKANYLDFIILTLKSPSSRWQHHTNSRMLCMTSWWRQASMWKCLPFVERPWRNNCMERTWAGRCPWSCDSQSQCLLTAQTQAHTEWGWWTQAGNEGIIKYCDVINYTFAFYTRGLHRDFPIQKSAVGSCCQHTRQQNSCFHSSE